jgi:GT2 family glycosyltransferase
MTGLACSVVVPSFNRAAKLDLLLAALAAQDTTEAFEVVVVLDGSTDDSIHVLQTWEQLQVFESLRWYEQARQGQARARNTGSFLARAPILIFLDDDCIPDPDLISVHLAHHASGERIAVLGDCEIVRSDSASPLDLAIWMWWEDTNYRRAAVGQPSSYRDFCTGNVSLRREDFARIGGFDQDFTGYGGEDYELGYRLLSSGVHFVADRHARARHFNDATVRQRAVAARQEAHGDVLIARKHPELTAGLRLMRFDRRRTQIAAALALYLPWVGAALCFLMLGLVAAYGRLRLRRRWLSCVDFIWKYSYWRGLRDILGSMDAVRALRESAAPTPTQSVDVGQPLAPQVAALNFDVPSLLEIRIDERAIGRLELKPDLTEPVLPWLVREITHHLAPSVVSISSSAPIGPVDPERSLPSI